MQKIIYRNPRGFKEIKEHTFWVLRDTKNKFFSQFEWEHGYRGMKFIDEIESATSWKTKKLALKWIKENDPMGFSMSKPVKVKIYNQITYIVPKIKGT